MRRGKYLLCSLRVRCSHAAFVYIVQGAFAARYEVRNTRFAVERCRARCLSYFHLFPGACQLHSTFSVCFSGMVDDMITAGPANTTVEEFLLLRTVALVRFFGDGFVEVPA